MLFVVWSVIQFILQATCDRPSQSFDQSLALGPHVAAIDLKKAERAFRKTALEANKTSNGRINLHEPEADEVEAQFGANAGILGFGITKTDDGRYLIENVDPHSHAENANLESHMQIVRINHKPVTEMTEDEVRKACRHSDPEELHLVLLNDVHSGNKGGEFPETDFDGNNHDPVYGLDDFASFEEENSLLSECVWSPDCLTQTKQTFTCLHPLDPKPGEHLTKDEYDCIKKLLRGVVAADFADEWIRRWFKSKCGSGAGSGQVQAREADVKPKTVQSFEDHDTHNDVHNDVSHEELGAHHDVDNDAHNNSQHDVILDEEAENVISQCRWTEGVEGLTQKFGELGCASGDVELGEQISARTYECVKKALVKRMPEESVNGYILHMCKSSAGEHDTPIHGGRGFQQAVLGKLQLNSTWQPPIQCQDDWQELGQEANEGNVEAIKESCTQSGHTLCEFTSTASEVKVLCVPQSCASKLPLIKDTMEKMPDAAKVECGPSSHHEQSPVNTNPKALSNFARTGVPANKALRNEFCKALHHHKHLRLTTKERRGPPIYSEALSSTHAKKRETSWELFVLCPNMKTQAQLDALPTHVREQYVLKPTNFIVQAVQDPSHRATWLSDRMEMMFHKEHQTITVDIGRPLDASTAYPRIGENLTDWHNSLELPEALQNADCRLVVQLYFVPMWDRDEAEKDELVVGTPRTDLVPTLQCCTGGVPCTESDRHWWKSFV